MTARPYLVRVGVLIALLALPLLPRNGGPLFGQTAPGPLTLLQRDTRRQLPTVASANQDFIALDDLAAAFQLTLREETDAITLTGRGRTIVLTPEQTIASVAGRVISLPSPPVRLNGRWHVPVDFIQRAAAGLSDQRLELRRASRLVIVGDLRVPRLMMRQEAAGPGARLSIESLPRSAATVTQDGTRLLIRFDADAIDPVFPPGQVPGFIQGAQVVEPSTIAVDLGPRAGTFRTATQITDTAIVLVIDLLPSQDSALPPPAVTQAEPPPAVPETTSDLPTLEALGSRFRTVVIDPGHGGDDAGARGVKGTEEKAITLAIARRVKAALEARLGVRVVMTRDDDRLVPIAERTALANNNKADLFVSLHANGSLRPEMSGAFIHTASFAGEALDPSIISPERLPAYGGGMRDIELVPWNLAQARYREQSETLARLLVETLTNRVPLAPAPLEAAPLRVLQSANMPAVLVEVGFLSNPQQEAQLATPAFQATLAQSILDAVVRYRGEAPAPEGGVVP